MLGKNKAEERVRLVEHLKTFCWQIIDMYQEGNGPGAMEPMSPALAKSMIGDEITRQLLGSVTGPSPSYLRITGNDKLQILAALIPYKKNIISARWIGPRNGGDTTAAYVTVRMKDIEALSELLLHLEGAELDVRDGTFGVFLK